MVWAVSLQFSSSSDSESVSILTSQGVGHLLFNCVCLHLAPQHLFLDLDLQYPVEPQWCLEALSLSEGLIRRAISSIHQCQVDLFGTHRATLSINWVFPQGWCGPIHTFHTDGLVSFCLFDSIYWGNECGSLLPSHMFFDATEQISCELLLCWESSNILHLPSILA